MEKAAHPNDDASDSTSRIIRFSRSLIYVIAGCLMVIGLSEARQILDLKSQLQAARDDAARLRESNALTSLHLETLESRDPAYAAAKITIAWDSYRRLGVVAAQNLPDRPAGQEYHLWVLDPTAFAPISAGLLNDSQPFTVTPVSTPRPGFAVTLEPAGGGKELTGPILFAVAPVP